MQNERPLCVVGSIRKTLLLFLRHTDTLGTRNVNTETNPSKIRNAKKCHQCRKQPKLEFAINILQPQENQLIQIIRQFQAHR